MKEFDYRKWMDDMRADIQRSWNESKKRQKRRIYRKTKLVRVGTNYLNVLRFIAKSQKTTIAKVIERFLSNSTMFAINRKEYLSYQQKAKMATENKSEIL